MSDAINKVEQQASGQGNMQFSGLTYIGQVIQNYAVLPKQGNPTASVAERVQQFEEWGFMILLKSDDSNANDPAYSAQHLNEYQHHRISHVKERAESRGLEWITDTRNADLLWLTGDRPGPLLELFHDLNHRNPVPCYLKFRPKFGMVAHYNRFSFTRLAEKGPRRELSNRHLKLIYCLEGACPTFTLLATRPAYELMEGCLSEDWDQKRKPIPNQLVEWRKVIANELYWIGLPK